MKSFLGLMRMKEKGGILILFALLLVPLIMVIALAVDSARLASSHSQQRDIAGFAALAALETYTVQQGSGASNEVSYAAAIDKAELTINHQLNKLMIKRNDGYENVSGVLYNPLGNGGNVNAGNNIGIIRGGNWWFSEPSDSSGNASCANWLSENPSGVGSCPCPSGVWSGACFQENVSGATSVGAFQVQLNTAADSPVKTVFARVNGPSTVQISSQSTAAKIPRRGVFIVDLSRSMVFETHAEDNHISGTPRATEYALRLRSEAGSYISNEKKQCNGPNDYTNNCIQSANFGDPERCAFSSSQHLGTWYSGRRILDSIDFSTGSPVFTFHTSPDPMGENRDLTLYDVKKHFRDDYECVAFNDGSDNQNYLIDTDGLLAAGPVPGDSSNVARPHPNAPSEELYQGPQPLTTVLASIHSALEKVQERSLAGDEIGVVFFDEETLDIRTFPASGGLTSPGQAAFTKLLNITDVTIDDAYPPKLIERLKSFIFPRVIPDTPTYRPANTNFPEALMKAVEMLEASEVSGAADNFIGLFTDGLSNCTHNPPGATSGSEGFVPNPTADHANFIELIDGEVSFPDKSCENVYSSDLARYNNHLVSLQETSAIIAGNPSSEVEGEANYALPEGFRTLQDRGIAIHTFLVGDKVKPSTYLIPNTEGNACMDAAEARRTSNVYSYGGERPADGGDSYSGDSTYTYPNTYLYANFTVPSGGTWSPVRPACDVADWNAAMPGNIIGSAEDTDAGRDARLAACNNGELEQAISQICVNAAGAILIDTVIPGILEEIGGAEGSSLICDPMCREPADSTGENIEEIYDRNPYVLVESINNNN